MNQTRYDAEACERAQAKLDEYTNGELLTATSPGLIEHFKSCQACAREAGQRRQIRARLRTAVREIRIPAGLEERVRSKLGGPQRSPGWGRLMAIAAGVAVCAGSWITYQAASLRVTRASQESYISTISTQLAAIMRVGLGDHIHCAVFRKPPKQTAADPVADNLPPEFKNLVPMVRERAPKEFALVMAHECRYHGRKFVHLTFQNETNLLSLVIARKSGGESLHTDNLLPALTQSGIPMYTSGADRFQIVAWESRDYLLYTVSDLPPQKNVDATVAFSTVVKDFLTHMEG